MQEVIKRIESNVINGNWQDAVEDMVFYKANINDLKRLDSSQVITLAEAIIRHYKKHIDYLQRKLK